MVEIFCDLPPHILSVHFLRLVHSAGDAGAKSLEKYYIYHIKSLEKYYICDEKSFQKVAII